MTTLTECLWGQLRQIDSNVGASLLYPSTRTPGMLNTGIGRPGANRPDKYDRPGAPPKEGRRRAQRLPRTRPGRPVWRCKFAPLEEVADICFEGIKHDIFCVSPSAPSRKQLTQSERDRRPGPPLGHSNKTSPRVPVGDGRKPD